MTADRTMPLVRTPYGDVRGRYQDGIAVFRGIPYAAPPFGPRRFRPPVPRTPWEGVRDAGTFGPTPPKPPYSEAFARLLSDPVVPGDDCLNLNVWTPEPGRGARLPVLVWIHGGALTRGSSAVPVYDGRAFARDGVVMVSINYRLGVEGYGLFPDAPPNPGLRDQLAALEWVREAIAEFGGDPDRVTVFGQSAGAISTGALLAAPQAQGLFRRAVLQSAPPEAFDREKVRRMVRRMAARLKIPATAEAFAAVDRELVLRTQAEVGRLSSPVLGGPAFGLVVDGDVVPRDPMEALVEGGAAPGVELLMGWTRDEYRLWLVPGGLMERVDRLGPVALAGAMARCHCGSEVPRGYRTLHPDARPAELLGQMVTDHLLRIPLHRLADARPGSSYVYEFAWPSNLPDLGACHALELGFVFDTGDVPESAKLAGEGARRRRPTRCTPHGCGSPQRATRAGLPGTPHIRCAFSARTGRPWCTVRATENSPCGTPNRRKRSLLGTHPHCALLPVCPGVVRHRCQPYAASVAPAAPVGRDDGDPQQLRLLNDRQAGAVPERRGYRLSRPGARQRAGIRPHPAHLRGQQRLSAPGRGIRRKETRGVRREEQPSRTHPARPGAPLNQRHDAMNAMNSTNAMNVPDFSYESRPVRVVFRPGAAATAPADEAGRLGLRRLLVVCGRQGAVAARAVATSLGSLCAGLHSEARMHVPVEVADRAVEVAHAAGADGCVAVGGGSVIGLGKAIALRTGLPLIAVPSTYAGSEMTSVWGLTEHGVKRTGHHPAALPRSVVYDPELTLSLPPALSVTSGFNAVAHAAEALYAPDTSPLVALMAEEGVRAMTSALPRVAADPEAIGPRGRALYGAWLCGSCLGATTMGLHHKLCQVLGGTFGLPHAETHTVVLPHALAHNAPAVPEAITALNRALDTDNAPHALWDLAGRLGAPRSLSRLGLTDDDLTVAAGQTAAEAYPNPRTVTMGGALEVLRAAYAGRSPHAAALA